MNNFGINLKQLIENDDVSIAELSRSTGISASTLSGYIGEGGAFPSKPEVLTSLASYFKISVHKLLTGEDDPNTPKGALESIIENKTHIHTGVYEVTIKKIDKE